jgi:hypothetical protein
MKHKLKFSLLSFLSIFLICSCHDLTSGSIDKPIIDGYTDKFSFNVGDSFQLYINASHSITDFQLEINDITGKVIKTIHCDIFPQKSPDSLAYQNGFNYKPTIKGTIPYLKSGVYLFANKIPFLIKSSKKKQILILYSSNTENAYCSSGGKSMYDYNEKEEKHPPIMSFLRPIGLPTQSTEFFEWIISQNQYEIGYISDQDMDNYENIKDAKLLIIPGHSEYWTRAARRNFDQFINEGNNALILSGNSMWWQVRYNENKNQMICYKNKLYDNAVDSLKTVNWPDSLLNYPVINSIGADFNYGGYGLNKDQGWDGFKITNQNSPILKSTGLKNGDILQLPTVEYDGIPLEFSKDSSLVKIKYSQLFYRSELIGYDLGFRAQPTNGTWIIIQPNIHSGIIINTASTDWCSASGMKGNHSKMIKKITLNMINLLLEEDKNNLFTK